MRRYNPLTTLVLLLGLLACATPLQAGYDDYYTGAMQALKLQNPPKALPLLSFMDGGNRPVSLQQFHGQVVLLMLWATWCPYCRQDIPKVDALARELGPRGLAVVAVAGDKEGTAPVTAFMRANNYMLNVYSDPHGQVADALHSNGIPYFVIIGRDGREIAHIAGLTDWSADEARGFLKAVLSEVAPQAPGAI